MMFRLLAPYLKTLLPLYLSGRLNRVQRALVVRWLASDEGARLRLQQLQTVHTALQRQPESHLPGAVLGRIEAEIDRKGSYAARINTGIWGLGMGLALTLVLFVLVALPPANVITWSFEGTPPESFLIYRSAQSGDADFVQVGDIHAAQAHNGYRYRDMLILPGRSYAYRVDAVAATGETISSQIVSVSSRPALPGQIALLAAFAICAYGFLVYLSDLRRPSPIWSRLGI